MFQSTRVHDHPSTLYPVSPKNTFSRTAQPGLCYPGKHHPPTFRAATRARRAFIPMSGVCASRPGARGTFQLPARNPQSTLSKPSPGDFPDTNPESGAPWREFPLRDLPANLSGTRIPQTQTPEREPQEPIPHAYSGTPRPEHPGSCFPARAVPKTPGQRALKPSPQSTSEWT